MILDVDFVKYLRKGDDLTTKDGIADACTLGVFIVEYVLWRKEFYKSIHIHTDISLQTTTHIHYFRAFENSYAKATLYNCRFRRRRRRRQHLGLVCG